ncbi:MAG TPA: hypothetical protein VLF63_02560 [Patescibacteria group bacterium]|nr:hypothetical protein [Patescibacteria group bacterium]
MKLQIKRLNINGFGHIELILALFVVGVIAVVGTYVVTNTNAKSPNAPSSPVTTPSSSGTITLKQTNPTYGSTVQLISTFTGIPSKSHAEVSLECLQSSKVVYLVAQADPNGGNSDSPWTTNYTLTSANWPSGSANCVADLYYYTLKGNVQSGSVKLATTSFVTQ